ncbi:MAG: N-acyl homoserine lactonase family protein, partial [Ferruginibacter sp.]|nr:N-acyl homoserine lactonase family protein [Cytophagales bacterium]
MVRRTFIHHASLGSVGWLAAKELRACRQKTFPVNPSPIVTTVVDGVSIHAIHCGWVKVKKSHRNPSAGAPVILLDPRWTEWLPIWVWVIEHPEGITVVDTGENQRVTDDDYFDCGGANGWVSKQILQFNIQEPFEIKNRLRTININPDDVRWVVLTHLHIDHTDGLKHFPKAEILVSKTEFNQPYGSVPCTFPSWFNPRKIEPTHPNEYFGKAYPLTTDGRVIIVPTHGHSYGHQSVIFRGAAVDLFLAGDTTFNEHQLQQRQVAGICIDKSSARKTIDAIRAYCGKRPTVYLPTHDSQSADRLKRQRPTQP